MPDSVVENLILDLLEWLGKQNRTYEETMEAWRTSCPKLPVWEDATDRGYQGSAGPGARRKPIRVVKDRNEVPPECEASGYKIE